MCIFVVAAMIVADGKWRRKKMVRSLKFGGAVVAAAMALTASVPAFAADKLKVGIVASMSGGFAAAAKDSLAGVEAWRKASGNEDKVTFEILDDETNAVNATNAYRRLADDSEISLVYLLVNSNSALAVKAFASEMKLPIISGGGADALGRPADPYMFKVAPAISDFIYVVTDYAAAKGLKKVAVLTSTDAYGQNEQKSFAEMAKEKGLEIVADEKFTVEDTSFNAQLTRIRAANPDIIYSGASGRAGILVYTQFKQFGLTAPLVVTSAALTQAFYDGIGGKDKAEGVMTPTQLGVFGADAGGETAKLYQDLATAIGGTPTYLNTFGYDVGLISGAAMEKGDWSREGLRAALAGLKDTPAVNGPVTYEEGDHTGQDHRSIGMGKLEGGKLVLAK